MKQYRCPYCGAISRVAYKGECPKCPRGAMNRYVETQERLRTLAELAEHAKKERQRCYAEQESRVRKGLLEKLQNLRDLIEDFDDYVCHWHRLRAATRHLREAQWIVESIFRAEEHYKDD